MTSKNVPAVLRLSASSLQDFVDCQRRFQLRYVQRQPWPAVQAEPMLEHEDHLERGSRFHRLVQRHQAGLDASLLTPKDADLAEWWQSYLGFSYLHDLVGDRYPEFTLSVEVAGKRLVATFDLLVVLPRERLYVFDWKTYKRSPSKEWFLSRIQTRVYSYVASRAGNVLFGGELSPDQVTMVYWVSSSPDGPVILPYSTESFRHDDDYLRSLAIQIDALSPDASDWGLTGDVRRCAFCEYRSLCERGDIPGFGDDYEVFPREETGFLGLADVEEAGF